jgi:hypothetical protein
MRRFLLVAALLTCSNAQAIGAPGVQGQATAPRTIHIGWVDISPDDWLPLGYANKQEWLELVKGGNEIFQTHCRRLLKGYEIVGAKDALEAYAGGQDLQVRFTDVRFDVDSYALHAAISIVSSTTGTDLVKVEKRSYRGGRFSVSSCLSGDFEKLAERVAKEIRQLEKRAK